MHEKSVPVQNPYKITKKSLFWAQVGQMIARKGSKGWGGGGPTNQVFGVFVDSGAQDGPLTAPRAPKPLKTTIFSGLGMRFFTILGTCWYVFPRFPDVKVNPNNPAKNTKKK